MKLAVDHPRKTRASATLAERFKSKRSGMQKRCADRTRINQSRLSKIISGKAFPVANEAARLEREEGIPVAWWDEPPTVAQIEAERVASEANPADEKGRVA
jgi:transcriptional regulator with XRE-family HTH domain